MASQDKTVNQESTSTSHNFTNYEELVDVAVSDNSLGLNANELEYMKSFMNSDEFKSTEPGKQLMERINVVFAHMEQPSLNLQKELSEQNSSEQKPDNK